MDPAREIKFECLPLLRVYNDGTVERLTNTGQVPPGHDPTTRTSSKDVVVDAAAPVLARLYLPESASADRKKLPILMFFHGGGFVVESAFSPLYHAFLNSLSARADVLVVSVEYRLAPEYMIPAAYDDCLAALKWAVSGSDVWLSDHGDVDRIFISGDSSGGNIAHNVALMAREAGYQFGFEGLVLINTYFWGTERLDSELDVDPNAFVQPSKVDKMWKFICGNDDNVDNDDPRLNPLVEAGKWVSKMNCKRIFVATGGKDSLRDRGRTYCESLRANGWEGILEFLEAEGEDHGFFLFKPECERSVEFMNKLVEFLKSS